MRRGLSALSILLGLAVACCGAPAFAYRAFASQAFADQAPPAISGRAAMKAIATTPTASSRKAMTKVGVAE